VIALIFNGKEILFEGIVKGKIALQPAGTEGFGYDPIFVPENNTRTFAQMNLSEKNRISHRSRAFEKLIEFLKS
jgi:XTP/dITP diphosphohydrolase